MTLKIFFDVHHVRINIVDNIMDIHFLNISINLLFLLRCAKLDLIIKLFCFVSINKIE